MEQIGVKDLLETSRACHQRAKILRTGKDSDAAQKELERAYHFRMLALDQDPDRKDEAWDEPVNGRATHDQMIRFYADQGIPATVQPI